ncbi:MAG: hypothetical protein FJ316_07765 [SAR202 cluster bacterium]|nr:hypothetical protein [SAR202 cluster bacterium]
MSRIFLGDVTKVDAEVLQKAKTLSDEFDVLFEFSKPGRNVDLLIVKHSREGGSALLLTEVKRTSRPVFGEVDGIWHAHNHDTGQWEPILLTNHDTNWYWQAVNTVNTLKQWLWSNQALIFEDGGMQRREQNDFRIWPDLLILSPAGIHHRLPMKPTSGFGSWWTDLDRWAQHLLGWMPNSPITLTKTEVNNLVKLLGLRQVWPESPQAATQEPKVEDTITLEDALTTLASYLRDLDRRVKLLEEQAQRQARTPPPPATPSPF